MVFSVMQCSARPLDRAKFLFYLLSDSVCTVYTYAKVGVKINVLKITVIKDTGAVTKPQTSHNIDCVLGSLCYRRPCSI
jgi:hypothetical protein